MAPILDPKFCSRCGAPMTRAVPPDDSRERHVCTKCAWIHYLDPKVACGTIAELDGKFALIQRNIQPKKGFWSFPCGFMEIDETTEQAALRETREETGLQVEIERPIRSIAYFFVRGRTRFHKTVHFYLMRATGGDLDQHDHEFDEVRWTDLEEALRLVTHATERNVLESATELLTERPGAAVAKGSGVAG